MRFKEFYSRIILEQNTEKFTIEYVADEESDEYTDQIENFYRGSINVLRGKEPYAVTLVDGEVKGVLFTELNEMEFSFDVVVKTEYQSSGMGKELTKIAFESYNEYKDIDETYYMKLNVVNPRYADFLIREYDLNVQETAGSTKILTDLTEFQIFLKDNDVDYNNLSWLGKGDFGEAYSDGNGKVVKKTTSKSEFEIAQKLEKDYIEEFAEVYATKHIKEEHPPYIIIMEELEEDFDIESLYDELSNILETQGLNYAEVDYLDEDELEEPLSSELQEFSLQISNILSSHRKLGIFSPDVRPENLGRSSDGSVKAFDIEDRSASHR